MSDNVLAETPSTIEPAKRSGLWRFLKDSAIVGIGSTAARLLGLVFSILLARFLTETDFGFVRYSLTLAGIFTIVSASAPASIGRFIAANPNDQPTRERYYSNGVFGFGIILAASLLVSVVAMLLLDAFDIGTLFAVIGLSVFFIYISVMRGLSNAWKMGLSYISTNVVLLLIAVIVLGFLNLATATIALVIYGLANCVPLVLLELVRKTPLKFRRELVSRQSLFELGKFSIPLIMANGAYTLWFGMDTVLIEALNPTYLSAYGIAKVLSQAFVFVPTAFSLVLMPKVAAMELKKSVRFCAFAAAAAFGVTLVGVLLVWLVGQPVISLLFNGKYADAYTPLLILGVGMSIYSVYLIVEGFMVGHGQPGSHAQAMTMAVIVATIVGVLLIPSTGLVGASLSFSLGATCGTGVLLFNFWRFLKKSNV